MSWLLATIAGLLALILFFFGWRGRRVGAAPHCRRCGYELTGRVDADRPSGSCAECGADLVRRGAVARGQRRRRPLVIVAALLCGAVFLGSISIGVVRGGLADAMLVRLPASVLLAVEPIGTEAIRRELMLRIVGVDGRSLSDAAAVRYAQRLIDRRDRLLAARRDAAEFDELQRSILRVIHDRVVMTDDMIVDWVRGAIEPGVSAIDPVPIRVGQHVPIGMSIDASLLGFPGLAMEVLAPRNAPFAVPPQTPELELTLVELAVPGRATPIRLGGKSQGGADSNRGLSSRVRADLAEGDHVLTLKAMLRVQVVDPDHPRAAWEVELPIAVRVLPAESDSVVPIVDPALRDAVRASFVAVLTPNAEVTIGGMSHRFFGTGVIALTEPLPMPVWMEIILRDDHGERPVGQLVVEAGRTSHSTLIRTDMEHIKSARGRVDIILRPNADRARQTFGTAAIWGEEIVLEGVPTATE